MKKRENSGMGAKPLGTERDSEVWLTGDWGEKPVPQPSPPHATLKPRLCLRHQLAQPQ